MIVIRAAHFAAEKHRHQRRKDVEKSPYINHPLAVAHVLGLEAGVTDRDVLAAAILHDTVEDTDATLDEIEAEFGSRVATLVDEVSDDKSLPKETRKELQVQHAADVSDDAKLLKIADKICNVRDLTASAPAEWSQDRVREYVDWSERVVANCKGVNDRLDRLHDEAVQAARTALEASS